MQSPFRVRLYNRRPTRDDMLADIRQVARGRKRRRMTYGLYVQHGSFSTNTIAHHFGSWSAALIAAGLPTNIDRSVAETDLFENLAAVWRALGRQPAIRDMVKRSGVSRFAAAAYESRFGSWNKALLAFQAFIGGKRPVRESADKSKGRQERPARPRSPRQINWRLRATVLIRDNCLCRMCGASPAKDPAVTLHVDHIVPWSKGGKTVLANLQTLCATCNIGKGALTESRLATRRRTPTSSRSSDRI
jgi:hypothetical protein